MKVEFLLAAEAELEDAVQWYNGRENGLGEELRAEVGNAIQRIILFPEGWARVSPRTRRCQVARFPYGVIYQVRSEMILIVAIMHLSRKPGYWNQRSGDV